MRKIILLFGILLISCTNVFAAKIPNEVQEYIYNSIPGTDIRFDGVIILPDNTIYLPLYPSLFSDIKKLDNLNRPISIKELKNTKYQWF